jgi:hypothetical protein
MPTYDGIGSSITHRVEVVGDSLFQDVDGGTLSTKVPVQIFSNYYASPGSVDSSRQLRFRVQPDGESNVSNSYVTDMGVKGADGSNYFFITAPQNTSNVGDQNTFVISTTSNVGIGTTDPEKPLHVVGDSWITGTLTASNIVGASPVTISSDLVMASGFTLTAGAIEPPTGSESNLKITGTITTSNLVANTGDNLLVSSNLEVGTSNLFVDTATGRVGIGTDSPTELLHIQADLNPTILVEDVGDVANQSRINFKTGYTDWSVGQHGQNNIGDFKIANSTDLATNTKVTIDTSGRVGIGKTNPNIHLDVGNALTNPKIGRHLSGSVHDADKRDTVYLGRWDSNLNEFAGMAVNVADYTSAGYGNCGNQATIKFYTWGCNYAGSREVMSILGSGTVVINTLSVTTLDVTNSGSTSNYLKIRSYMSNGSTRSVSGLQFWSNPQFGNGDNGQRNSAWINTGFYDGSWATYMSLHTRSGAGSGTAQQPIMCKQSFVGINNVDSPGVPLDVKTTGNYSGIGLLGSTSGRYTISTSSNGANMYFSHGSYSFGRWANAHHYDVYSNSDMTGSRDFFLNYYSGAQVLLAGYAVVTSDDRIKTNEEYIENATETIMKLKPQKYLKGPNLGSTSTTSRIETGLIAQDVYYDAPELRHLVSLADDAEPPDEKPFVDDDPQNDPDYSSWGSKSAGINYEGLISYLIKSNQEQQALIEDLRARIEAFENSS